MYNYKLYFLEVINNLNENIVYKMIFRFETFYKNI